MHTAESKFSNFVIDAKSKSNSKIIKHVFQWHGLVRSMKKYEVENLVTHSL